MEKAYDLKELGKRLAAKGLVEVEEGAEKCVEELFVWLEESAKLSSNPWDDMGLVVLPKLKEMALKGADKISDHDNQES